MKRDEAGEILALLCSAYHRESLDTGTVDLWVEVIEPHDAEIAMTVVMSWIKTQDRFPTISQYRHAYHVERRRIGEPELSAAATPTDVLDLDKNECPQWVQRWLRRFKVVTALPGPRERAAFEDWRVFPEQIAGEIVYRDDPRFTTDEAKALGVMPEDAWLDTR